MCVEWPLMVWRTGSAWSTAAARYQINITYYYCVRGEHNMFATARAKKNPTSTQSTHISLLRYPCPITLRPPSLYIGIILYAAGIIFRRCELIHINAANLLCWPFLPNHTFYSCCSEPSSEQLACQYSCVYIFRNYFRSSTKF